MNKSTLSDMTAFMHAAYRGQETVVKLLLKMDDIQDSNMNL